MIDINLVHCHSHMILQVANYIRPFMLPTLNDIFSLGMGTQILFVLQCCDTVSCVIWPV